MSILFKLESQSLEFEICEESWSHETTGVLQEDGEIEWEEEPLPHEQGLKEYRASLHKMAVDFYHYAGCLKSVDQIRFAIGGTLYKMTVTGR